MTMALQAFLFVLATTAVTARPSFYEGHGLGPDESKLISQSVHLHEVPTKVIKVTKTVAIKVPVPYPVKVPHHIPFPVPVKQPVAIPVPQIVKVPQHVPIPVQKPFPVEVHQQVPFLISKPVPIPHPVPVPHPVPLSKPVFISVPKVITIPQSSHSEGGITGIGNDHAGHETVNYSSYSVNVQDHGTDDQQNGNQAHFQSSPSDYSADH
ncbi:MAGE-like protein 2 [Cataglyphis hispanica]|uniref:MAGE-like protein 2 n=1 Tax=Cataglyphis hispanica TaxID=1086592 RepID=UPI00217F781D|nr:MAGE-like protein 2 [Cataglyphis hispanica]